MALKIVVVIVIGLAADGAVADPGATVDPAWSVGPPRWFVAAEGNVGAVVNGHLEVGYGQPHGTWVGAEALALSTVDFGAAYAGVRGKLPFLDLTAGLRRSRSYDHPFLPVQDRYAAIDGSPGAGVVSLDLSATAYAPVPLGYAMLWVDVIRPLGLGPDRRYFEEYERAVVGVGTTVAARLTWFAALAHDRVLVGPTVEHLWLGGRDVGLWRIGAAVSYTISPRWQVNAILTSPVAGRDDLGWFDALWGTATVSYRWATR
jgi:hypothetical protein